MPTTPIGCGWTQASPGIKGTGTERERGFIQSAKWERACRIALAVVYSSPKSVSARLLQLKSASIAAIIASSESSKADKNLFKSVRRLSAEGFGLARNAAR